MDQQRLTISTNGRGKADVLGFAVEGEIASDDVGGFRIFLQFCDVEGGFGELFDIEEVRTLEVACEFLVVGKGGFHVDDDLVIVSDRRSILDGEMAGEGLESAVMTAGHLGAGEIHLGIGGEDIPGSTFGRSAGLVDRFGNRGTGGLVSGVLTGNECHRGGKHEC